MLDDALTDYYEAMRTPGANASGWWDDNRDRYRHDATTEARTKADTSFITGLGDGVFVKGDAAKTSQNILRPEIWLSLSRRQKERMEKWMMRNRAIEEGKK